MSERPEFLLVTCQIGAETAVKQELARRWPDFHFAYSRPGFLTFKLSPEHQLGPEVDLGAVFARASAFSLGRIRGTDPEQMAREVWRVYQGRPPRRLHVWQRDTTRPGEEGFTSPVSAVTMEIAERLCQCAPHPESLADDAGDPRRPARPGEQVLDCVLVQPDEWWVGCHRAKSEASAWPGGAIQLEMPENAVSRAWLKMEEGLRWSKLPISAGARCAELGSSPGGGSQALLSRGMIVTGVDPAEMHPVVLAHPNFTHLRRRSNQVRRREFRKIRWLTADMNVAPSYTLDAVESLVTHPEIHVRGMLLTLKLGTWKLADQIPDYLQRIREWGYNVVRARQLLYNRQEICVAALQKPFARKPLGPR